MSKKLLQATIDNETAIEDLTGDQARLGLRALLAAGYVTDEHMRRMIVLVTGFLPDSTEALPLPKATTDD